MKGTKMDNFKDFMIEYRGAIIGAIVAILTLIFQIHKFVIGCLIIIAGILLGNYIQRNKETVKEKIRKVLDRW